MLAGRVEQGVVKPGEEVIFLPTHTASNPCAGKVFTVEMHYQRVDCTNPGDNVGLNTASWTPACRTQADRQAERYYEMAEHRRNVGNAVPHSL